MRKTFTMSRLFASGVAALSAFAAVAVHAQTTKPSDGLSVKWPTVTCKGQPGVCDRQEGKGILFAQPGQTKIVLISHGSQGVDARMYDYVDALKAENIAALVIDHWSPRGISTTHEDYAAASAKGGSELNMVFDSFTAADWLRREKGFTRVGSIGESQGAAAAIMLQQKWLRPLMERNVTRIYSKSSWKAQNFDAVAGLYGFCGIRVLERDAFVDTPFLMVTGEKDDETPSKLCEAFIPYMNERGAKAQVSVVPGVYHSFDAPYRQQRSQGPHYGKCEIVADGKETKDLNSGATVAGTNVPAVMSKCVGRGYTTGNSGNRLIGVPVWMAFFKENL